MTGQMTAIFMNTIRIGNMARLYCMHGSTMGSPSGWLGVRFLSFFFIDFIVSLVISALKFLASTRNYQLSGSEITRHPFRNDRLVPIAETKLQIREI